MNFVFDKTKVDWSFYASGYGKPHRHLIAVCGAGLCNRLLVFAGCRRLAQKLGRKLILWWPINGADGVGCAFDKLFTDTVHLMNEDDLHWALDCAHSLKLYNPDEFKQIANDDSAQVVMIRAFYHPLLAGEPIGDAIKEVRGILQCLEPVPEVRARVAALNLHPEAFSVHVRREPLYMGSTNDKFFKVVDAHLTSHPEFFLASDHYQVDDAFKARYGSAVKTLPKPRIERDLTRAYPERAHEQGMLDAMVDLYALASRTPVIGTAHSTFSTVAAMLGGRSQPDILV